ncbi:MAG: hypothetical protein ACXVH1_26030 [Solirubrobacteraceae bacterium]
MAVNITKSNGRTCAHARHNGSCPSCQRAQLARWRAQLAAVSPSRAIRAADVR